jgi:hypothetical protein
MREQIIADTISASMLGEIVRRSRARPGILDRIGHCDCRMKCCQPLA